MLTATFFEQRVQKCAKKGIQPFQIYRIYIFFIMIIIFTFSPPSTLVPRLAWKSNHRRAYSPPAISSSKLVSGVVRHVSNFVPKLDYYFSDFVSTRFKFAGILRYFFLYCTCRNPNKTSSTVPHRPPIRRSTAAFAGLMQHTLHALRQYNKSSYS